MALLLVPDRTFTDKGWFDSLATAAGFFDRTYADAGAPPSGVYVVDSYPVLWTSATTAYNVTAPATLTAGDLVWVQFQNADTVGSFTTVPSGWTVEVPVLHASGGNMITAYWHVVTSGEEASPPASWNFVWANSLAGNALVTILRGADQTTPIDVGYAAVTNGTTTKTVPAITTVTDGAYVLGGGQLQSATTQSVNVPASGWVELATSCLLSAGRGGVLGGKGQQAVAGTTGTAAFTQTSALQGYAYQVAIRPAAAGSPASGTAALTLTATNTGASGAAVGTAAVALVATGTARAAVAGSAAVTLTATGTARAAAAGSASLTFTASGTASIPAAGSAALDLAATGSASGSSPASGTAAITLTASGSARGAASGTAALTLTATGASAARASGAAAITVTASGTARAASTGTAAITVTATGTARAPVAGAAAMTVTATGSATAGASPASGTATVELTAVGAAAARAASTATVTIVATATAAGAMLAQAVLELTATGTAEVGTAYVRGSLHGGTPAGPSLAVGDRRTAGVRTGYRAGPGLDGASRAVPGVGGGTPVPSTVKGGTP